MTKPYKKSLLSLLLPRIGGAPPRQPTAPSAPMFQAVSIQRGAKVCDIAKRLGERRFLAKNSPVLPLPGCTIQGECQCRYRKHPDRRVEPRRLMDVGMSTLIFDAKEQRSRKGRRSTD